MEGMKEELDALLEELQPLIETGSDRDETLLKVCQVLREKVDYYHWVGFYIVDPESPRELYLGPYVGKETDHARIPFGQGVCGQSAEKECVMIIDDVNTEENYLCCSVDVSSEIVVPVWKNGKYVAQIDIDSKDLAPFTEEDTDFLGKVCEMVSRFF